MERVSAATWWMLGDGKPIAHGTGHRVEQKSVPVHLLGEVETDATPKREFLLELRVDGKLAAAGKARCERWGRDLRIVADGFRVEAGK